MCASAARSEGATVCTGAWQVVQRALVVASGILSASAIRAARAVVRVAYARECTSCWDHVTNCRLFSSAPPWQLLFAQDCGPVMGRNSRIVPVPADWAEIRCATSGTPRERKKTPINLRVGFCFRFMKDWVCRGILAAVPFSPSILLGVPYTEINPRVFRFETSKSSPP